MKIEGYMIVPTGPFAQTRFTQMGKNEAAREYTIYHSENDAKEAKGKMLHEEAIATTIMKIKIVPNS